MRTVSLKLNRTLLKNINIFEIIMLFQNYNKAKLIVIGC
jgi:hypothetical protein